MSNGAACMIKESIPAEAFFTQYFFLIKLRHGVLFLKNIYDLNRAIIEMIGNHEIGGVHLISIHSIGV